MTTAATRFDVVVVGAGFAGLTAARELSLRGCRTVVLEARDRIGGRTWGGTFAGRPVELGGTWLHWLQPHVWSEVTRYGLEISESPTAEHAIWLRDGVLRTAAAAELWARAAVALSQFHADSEMAAERPYDHEHHLDEVVRLDALSGADRMATLDLDPDDRAILGGMLTGLSSAPLAEVGLMALLHGYALCGWSSAMYGDTGGRYKFQHGTRSLLDAIVNDGGIDVRTGRFVSTIAHDAGGVNVTTADGDVVAAAAAVVAVPLNVLPQIRFAPVLSEVKRETARRRQASRGVKVWVRLRGDVGRFVAIAPEPYTLNWLGAEDWVDGDTICVGFGAKAEDIDLADTPSVARAIHDLLPDAELVEAGGHDWTQDPLSLGTWCTLRPGQTTLVPELQRPEGRLFFAGGDIATGWHGYIDGAIETGIRAAREILALFGATRS